MKTPGNLQVVGCCFDGSDGGITGARGMHTSLPWSCAFRVRPSDVSGATAASRLAFRVQPLTPGLLAPPRLRTQAWPIFGPESGVGAGVGISIFPMLLSYRTMFSCNDRSSRFACSGVRMIRLFTRAF